MVAMEWVEGVMVIAVEVRVVAEAMLAEEVMVASDGGSGGSGDWRGRCWWERSVGDQVW